jgi:raffinose/stachyose/melibiose transport system substrate-binding protein
MAIKRTLGVVAAVTATALLLAGCSTGSSTSSSKPKGTITVLTNRTDLVKTTFVTYAKEFEKAYPGTTVKFQAITNYEGDVAVRLNSKNYGDVLDIPNSVKPNQLPEFFVPFGTVSALGKTWRFIHQEAYNGKVYGISTFGNAQGIVYNKKIWAQAGLTGPAKSTSEFIADLKKIKANTSAIPYYTNYKDQWPLSQWQGNIGIEGNTNANNALTGSDAPWTPGQPQYIADNLLFNLVKDKLTEPDPTTTDWNTSKTLIGSGKIATMLLGSWAISQMQAAAVTAGGKASDIGYLPFPYQKNGTFYSTISSDYTLGVSKYSKNRVTAEAWVQWFNTKSGFAASQGAIAPQVGSANPSTLADFTTDKVKYVEENPAPAGKESLQQNIASAAQIDLSGYVYRQKLVDIARGAASGSESAYFAQLNSEWKAAKATATP